MASSPLSIQKKQIVQNCKKSKNYRKKYQFFFFFFCVHRNYLESICKKKMARCVSPTLNSDFIEAQLKMQDELIFGFFGFFEF